MTQKHGEIRNGVAEILLSRPESYNALSLESMATLIQTLKKISKNPAAKVVVIKGAGRGFCAGHDLREILANRTPGFYRKLMATCKQLMQTIRTLPQPVIAQVHGTASAAGCQLVASCDLAYAADDARFSTPGVFIGLFCSTPMLPLSRTVLTKNAMEMLLTGEAISARRALEFGLINGAFPAAALDAEVDRVAEKIAGKSSYVIGLGKTAFYKQLEMPLNRAYEYASEVMVKNLMAPDALEGIRCFLEKKTPVWHELAREKNTKQDARRNPRKNSRRNRQ